MQFSPVSNDLKNKIECDSELANWALQDSVKFFKNAAGYCCLKLPALSQITGFDGINCFQKHLFLCLLQFT